MLPIYKFTEIKRPVRKNRPKLAERNNVLLDGLQFAEQSMRFLIWPGSKEKRIPRASGFPIAKRDPKVWPKKPMTA